MSRQKFYVATGFGARPRCLGRDKGLLVSRQGFPKGGPFLSRHKNLCQNKLSKGGVAIECFLSRPTDQACLPDRALGARAQQAWARA